MDINLFERLVLVWVVYAVQVLIKPRSNGITVYLPVDMGGLTGCSKIQLQCYLPGLTN